APYAGALRHEQPQRAALTDYWTAQALGGITAVDIPGGHFDCLNAAFVDTRLKEAR
ncbi:pyochelin synthetase, partial [Burkholderia cenocepacia]|nr:pyochelin synthetase [Burkholderia cenocepacia]